MSKKTRQMVTMIVLCILLIGAGIGYYGLIRYQTSQEKEKEESEESEGIAVYSLEEGDINKIYYKSDKAEMTLVKTKDIWTKQEDKEFPLNQETVSSMLTEASALTADRLVTENCKDISQYQLDKPALTVQVEDTGGNQKTVVMGAESIAGGGRYAYCDDSSKIYIIPTTLYSAFDYTNNQMIEVAAIPEVTADYVTHLKIDSSSGKGFEATYDKKNSRYKDIYSWAISKPYSQEVAGDVDQLQTLFTNYSSLSFAECVSYKKNKSLKKYGLDHPSWKITLDYYDVVNEDGEIISAEETETEDTDTEKTKKVQKKLQLSIGTKNSDKTAYYVQIAGDNGVYLMEQSTVETMVKITPLDYVYQKFYVSDEEKLQSIDMEYQGKSYHMTLTRTKNKQESDETDEEEEYTYTAKINGKKADAQKFRDIYAAFGELAPNSEIDSKVTPVGNKPIATITFHEKKKSVTMKIYPYDGNNFYRVEVNGIIQFVTDIRNVDDVLEESAKLSRK